MRIEGNSEAWAMPVFRNNSSEMREAKPQAVEKPVEQTKKITEEKSMLSEDEIFQQVQDANQQLKMYDRRLEFSIHDETHRIMVKVINTNDDSVIREIPSEKALDMLAYVWKMTGILVDEKR